ncbi:hypothetical protein CLAIMM_12656 [Cladophialophora immunda]|nr:hypothetical protein CLAIMM_12656 [Cladophialophora immunda]
MAGESDTPQTPRANAVCHELDEDAPADVVRWIEEDRTTPTAPTPVEPLKNDHISGNSHTCRLSTLHGRQGMENVSSDEVQFDFAPIQQDHLDHQYVELPCGVDNGVVKRPGSISSPKVHTMIRGYHDNETNVPQPSEEDLLFLLMSRARETQKALERLKDLEHENQNLRELQGQTEAELQQTVKTRDECSQYSDFLCQSLDIFKQKYCKLKKWALETNKDCEMLQEKASGFHRTLTALTKDRDQLLTQLRGLQCSSDSSSEQLESIRDGVREAKAMAEDSTVTIRQLEAFAMAQNEHLMSETQRCRRLEAHILQLEQEKNKQNIRLYSQHQATNQTLQDISKGLATLHKERAEEDSATTRIIERLHQIQSAIDNNLPVKSDLAPLRDDCISVNSSIAKLEGSLSEKVQTAVASLKHDLQHDVSTQVSRLLSEVQSGNVELVEAKAEVARLQAKIEQTQEIMELLHEAKREAQKHEAELQATNQSLRNNKAAALTQSEELRTSLRTVTTKWQTASSELEKCKQDKSEVQAEVIDLTIRLSEATQEHNVLQAELMASEDILGEFEQQNEEQTMELRRVNAQLSDVQGDLNCEIQRRFEVDAEVARTKARELQTRRDLKKSRDETTTAIRVHKELQSQIGMLEQKLTGADQNARKLEDTLKSLADTESELGYLRQQQSSLQRLKEESVSQTQQIADKSKEIETLQKQVNNLGNTSARFEEQAKGKDRLAKEYASLQNDMENLRGQLSEQEALEKRLQQKITEIAVLESALAAAQIQATRLNEVETENSSLKEDVDSLTADLGRLNEQCTQIAPLQGTIREKDSQITELQKDLALFNDLTEQLKNLRAEVQENEKQQASMQQEILSLEAVISNAKLDGDEANHNQRQRRVADRSGNAKDRYHNQLPLTRQHSNGGGVQFLNVDSPLRSNPPGPTNSPIAVVPETQIEIHESPPIDPDSFVLSADQGQEDSRSELAPIPNDDGEADLDEVINHALNLITSRHDRSQIEVWSKGTSSIRRSQGAVEQPPSSSYGSQSDQMLLDQVSQDEDQGPNDFDSTETGPTFVVPGSKVRPKQGPSPRRLRSELRGRNRRFTASPDTSAEFEGNRASTPAIMRERYQPNSAAKRRMEPENDEDKIPPENPKRLKRTTANLEARKPPPASPKQRVDKSSSRGAISFRKSSNGRGSSIVGTNAPGPGKSQRSAKPARKGSRQDKYATRFGAET